MLTLLSLISRPYRHEVQDAPVYHKTYRLMLKTTNFFRIVRCIIKETDAYPALFIGFGATLLTAFSVAANLKMLLSVDRDRNSEARAYRFLHGMRACSIFFVVLGHSIFDYAVVLCEYGNVIGRYIELLSQ